MLDQANRLRLLKRASVRGVTDAAAPRPGFFVVAGGKGGVGTTTIAVNLAVALARGGRRAALVDGDLGRADATALCGLRETYSIVDVLAGRRSVREALQPGPAGIQVLPGAWATGHLTDCDPAAQERLMADLAGLPDVDQVVIDAGCGLNRVLQRFWRSADQALLVTTPDHLSVMNAYAVLKTLRDERRGMPVRAAVNQAGDAWEAGDAHARLAAACRRFLALELNAAAPLMASREVTAAARRQRPFVLASPGCSATRAIEQLAAELAAANLSGETDEFPQAIQAA